MTDRHEVPLSDVERRRAALLELGYSPAQIERVLALLSRADSVIPEVAETDEPPLCGCGKHYVGAPCHEALALARRIFGFDEASPDTIAADARRLTELLLGREGS